MTEKESIAAMQKDFERNETESIHIAKFNRMDAGEKQLVLQYLHHGTIKAVAAKYNCSASWMGKKLRRILQNLR